MYYSPHNLELNLLPQMSAAVVILGNKKLWLVNKSSVSIMYLQITTSRKAIIEYWIFRLVIICITLTKDVIYNQW